MQNASNMRFVALALLALMLSLSCQSSPDFSRPKIESAEGAMTSVEVSTAGILEFLPHSSGFMYFTAVEIEDVAVWSSFDDGLHSYYYAYLPLGMRHRISIHELLPFAISDEFQLPQGLDPTLTIFLRGRHVAAPAWPAPKRPSVKSFIVRVQIPKEWLILAVQCRP